MKSRPGKPESVGGQTRGSSSVRRKRCSGQLQDARTSLGKAEKRTAWTFRESIASSNTASTNVRKPRESSVSTEVVDQLPHPVRNTACRKPFTRKTQQLAQELQSASSPAGVRAHPALSAAQAQRRPMESTTEVRGGPKSSRVEGLPRRNHRESSTVRITDLYRR